MKCMQLSYFQEGKKEREKKNGKNDSDIKLNQCPIENPIAFHYNSNDA